ncbi:DinB family protein [Kitasatospora sp. NA04385]|uniref:DinB family protein n=1 Tax=Kitasatospora sp. NA04385 TaxID=2742135 RepID=UPI001590758E|nr:DinB family protein [Kitasatospora sp. NA04385]QKW20427.1 DinB family protein [Kitasatospora sp. NA04385]
MSTETVETAQTAEAAEAVQTAEAVQATETARTADDQYPAATAEGPTPEHADLIAELRTIRHFLRLTARDLDDEQASRRTTVSELTIGGLIKHVTSMERAWAAFIAVGTSALPDFNAMAEADYQARADEFRLLPGETLLGVLTAYEAVARGTDELLAGLADLNVSHPLPSAPWFAPGVSWSARRTVLHIIAETAQHAGHADIIRESLDGQKSMG